jgi:hypothetical protein
MGELDDEFGKGAAKLLAALYLSPGPVDIPQLPAVDGEKKSEPSLPFQSRIVDFKLKRAVEQQLKTHTDLLQEFPQVLSDVEKSHATACDLTERFLPAPVPRRDPPKWREVEEKAKADEAMGRARAKQRRTATGRKEVENERQNTEALKRLQRSEAGGHKRAQVRFRAMTRPIARPEE